MGGMGTKAEFSEETWQILPIGHCTASFSFSFLVFSIPWSTPQVEGYLSFSYSNYLNFRTMESTNNLVIKIEVVWTANFLVHLWS